MTGASVCSKCPHSIDDHGPGGCLMCAKMRVSCNLLSADSGRPSVAAGPSITLLLQMDGGSVPVNMPAATTARYAAKRCAEAIGLDPQAREYVLLGMGRSSVIDGSVVMAPWDGRPVRLGWQR